jgi:dsDNA-specific endonuclease/ATPase MutS2
MRSHQLKTEEDRELEIIHELAEGVLPFAEAISEACDICAELDCLLCFAEAASQYNYRRPQMSVENVINIKQGRCAYFRRPAMLLPPDRSFISTGTRCRNKSSTLSCQMTPSLSAEQELVHP